jgi:hypothetical protein
VKIGTQKVILPALKTAFKNMKFIGYRRVVNYTCDKSWALCLLREILTNFMKLALRGYSPAGAQMRHGVCFNWALRPHSTAGRSALRVVQSHLQPDADPISSSVAQLHGAASCAAIQDLPTHLMEPGSSLPCSQHPFTGFYPESDQSSPHHPIHL